MIKRIGLKVLKSLIHCIGGGIKGLWSTVANILSCCMLTKRRIERQRVCIEKQSAEYKELLAGIREDAGDATIVGGVLLADIISQSYTKVPADIIEAYETAYPGIAEKFNFKDAVKLYDGDELRGFINGVKGKLFEIKYVDYLNSGALPDGYSATLAESPTNPGWDIKVTGADGGVAELFQLKATDSVYYVQDAMEHYPDIDVVTTNEVASQLVMHASDGGAEVIDSGISNLALENVLDGAVDNSYSALDSLNDHIPVISLALIAFTVYTKRDADIYRKSFVFGERGMKAMIAYTVGSAVAGVTGMWIPGVVAALGTRLVAGSGRRKRAVYRQLLQTKKMNRVVIRRYRKLKKRVRWRKFINSICFWRRVYCGG